MTYNITATKGAETDFYEGLTLDKAIRLKHGLTLKGWTCEILANENTIITPKLAVDFRNEMIDFAGELHESDFNTWLRNRR